MVLASLSDCQRYYSLNPLFRRAFEFYEQEGRFWEDGRYNIDEDRVILILSRNAMRPAEEAPLEAHNDYIDIQIPISGAEGYGVRDRSECHDSDGGYDPERDIEFFKDRFTNEVTLQQGDFIVFFPEDAHAPLVGNGLLRKAIFKIKVIRVRENED